MSCLHPDFAFVTLTGRGMISLGSAVTSSGIDLDHPGIVGKIQSLDWKPGAQVPRFAPSCATYLVMFEISTSLRDLIIQVTSFGGFGILYRSLGVLSSVRLTDFFH